MYKRKPETTASVALCQGPVYLDLILLVLDSYEGFVIKKNTVLSNPKHQISFVTL